MRWNESVVLVTGATSGIGKATALAFAARGAKVALAGRNAEAGRALVNEIQERIGAKALFVKCDVSRAADVENLVQETVKHFGKIDCAFNNSGIEGQLALTDECTEENWDQVMGVNLKGVWLCMKYEIQSMLKEGRGCIVNCASIAGRIGWPSTPAYAASKHGVIGLTQTAALEYAKRGLRINAISPGVIDTPMILRFTGDSAEKKNLLLAGVPMGRLGRPEEIAEAVLWLCSDESSFVTGHSLMADGGWTAK